MNLALINIKSTLLVVMVKKLYALMIDVVNKCKNYQVKMQFTRLLKYFMEMNIVNKLEKRVLKKNL